MEDSVFFGLDVALFIRATLPTARGRVGKTFLGKEILITRCEHKLFTAVPTSDSLILINAHVFATNNIVHYRTDKAKGGIKGMKYLDCVANLTHATLIIGWNDGQVGERLGVSPFDVVSMRADDGGGIQAARAFCNQMMLSPQFDDCRLGVVHQADLLTPEAQNALLKILEEPPSRAKIILLAEREASILPTIRSRCRVVYVPRDGPRELIEPYGENDLGRFKAMEALAAGDNVRLVVQSWLTEKYRAWCATGRPADGIDEVERFWTCYLNIGPNVSKRLILERLVVSSLQ